MSSSSTTIGPDTVVLDTLDEPVSATIKRDLVAIWNKVKVVLHPSSQEHVLRDCRWSGARDRELDREGYWDKRLNPSLTIPPYL